MEVLIGITGTGAYLLVLILLCQKYPSISVPLAVGGLIRLIFAWVIGLNLMEIPGTTSDARVFELRSREWAELPWSEFLLAFDPSRSYVISWFGGLIYKFTGPSPVLLNIINALLSVWLIVLTYKVSSRLFGAERGQAASWIVAIFPYAILYGSVFRREVFGSVFFMLGLLRAMAWAKFHNPFTLLVCLAFFGAAGAFHSGYAFGIVGLLGFSMVTMGSVFFLRRSDRSVSILISGLLSTLIVSVGLVALMASGASLNKVGEIDSFSVTDAIDYRVAQRVSEGGSSYPSWLRGQDPFANPHVIIGRFFYFILSPFPWDISAPSHLLGFFATVYFFLIFRSIIRSRRIIFARREAAIVLVITISAVLVFALSIDNIGTSLRHRTKFVYPLAALCALPLLRRYRFTMRRVGRGDY